MDQVVKYVSSKGEREPKITVSANTIKGIKIGHRATKQANGLKLQNLKKMKNKSVVFGLVLLFSCVHAQSQEKCPNAFVIQKDLYDRFQTLKSSKDGADRELTKDRYILDALLKRYLVCEKQDDIAAILKQAEESLRSAEINSKTSGEAYEKVEAEVRKIIKDAHKVPVEYTFYEKFYGNFGRVVTMTFDLQEDDKVEVIPNFYVLPDHMANDMGATLPSTKKP